MACSISFITISREKNRGMTVFPRNNNTYMANTPTVMFNITGTVKAAYPMEIHGKFRKRNLIVSDQFGNDLAFETTFENADNLDSFPPGTQVNLTFFISSREWNSPTKGVQWFTSATVKDMHLAAQPATTAPATVAAPTAVAPQTAIPEAAPVAATEAAPVGVAPPF